MTHDLLIAGGGPSAIALAAAADSLGLRTCIVAPAGTEQDGTTRALFADEAAGVPLAASMPRTVVIAGADNARVDLGRGYAVLDVSAYAASLPGRVQVIRGRVVGAIDAGVVLDDGAILSARAVVDATGFAPSLVKLESGRTAWQTAFGQVVEGDLGLDADEAVLMDWSPASAEDPECVALPSFLYALPLGRGRFLVEETSLCARPALDVDTLARRLHERLARRGARVARFVEEERVWIPMGTGLPRRGQNVAAFGAALGLVHPATGYSVGRALQLAPLVARVIADAIADGRKDVALGDRVLDAVWTPGQREARAVFLMALEASRRFSAPQANRFFASFFELPRPTWQGFLDGTLAPQPLRAAMLHLFAKSDARTRFALAKGLFAPASLDVMRGFLGFSMSSGGVQ